MTTSSQNAPDDLTENLSDLLEGLVERLVDDPDAIHVEADQADASITLRLYVAPDDLGKVIGKQGRTARALRTILSAIGSKADQRIQLDVLEDDESGEDESEKDEEAGSTEEA